VKKITFYIFNLIYKAMEYNNGQTVDCTEVNGWPQRRSRSRVYGSGMWTDFGVEVAGFLGGWKQGRQKRMG
jgi:hypothetical protein